MNRRGFLGGMLAACAAPAIVRAGSLMAGRGLIVPMNGLVKRVDVLYGWSVADSGFSVRTTDVYQIEDYPGSVLDNLHRNAQRDLNRNIRALVDMIPLLYDPISGIRCT